MYGNDINAEHAPLALNIFVFKDSNIPDDKCVARSARKTFIKV